MKNVPIGEVLKENGFITEEQLQTALAESKKQNGQKRLGQILVDMGYVTEQQVNTALGQRLGYQLVNLETTRVDTAAVAIVPKQLALKYSLIPIRSDDTKVTIATSDPLNFYGLEDVRQIIGKHLEIVIADQKSIQNAIQYYYAEIDAKEQAIIAREQARDAQAPILDINMNEEAADDGNVVRLLNSMLLQGYTSGASDIHIEPFQDKTSIRMRIDGVIMDYMTLPLTLHLSLIARIKILSNLDIAERRLPQDGHFRSRIENSDINIRTSVIPTVYGEKAVLRFLSGDAAVDRFAQFGMDEDSYQKVARMLKMPHGIIYLTGPTGSGKTTTLYMILEQMAKRQVNISTIEDPVERNLARINQVQVNNTSGLTFEVGLRSLLRQDPDIIMVGETRDAETAEISVRAAITGHLVFSTLHTNDSISSIVRLEDMGIPTYMVSSSLVGLVAQRLVRKVCPYCKQEYTPDAAERKVIGPNITKVVKGTGCPYCKNTGYKGRIAVHEVAMIDAELRRMIVEKASVAEMQAYAVQAQGMHTLYDSTLKLVANQVTTVEELLKITYSI